MRELTCVLLCAMALHAEDVQQAEARLREETKRAFVEGEADLGKSDENVATVLRALDHSRVDMDFDDASIDDVVGFLREYLKINLEIAGTVRDSVEGNGTFHLRNATGREALQVILDHWHLAYYLDNKLLLLGPIPPPVQALRLSATIKRGTHFLVAPGKAPDPGDAEILERLRVTQISLNSSDVPVTEMFGWLEGYCNVRFRVLPCSAEAISKLKLSFRCDGLPVDQVMDLFARMGGFGWVVEHGEVLLLCAGDAAESIDPKIKTEFADGLTPLGKNPQGCEEFRHERTGIVFVRVPPGEYEMGVAAAEEKGSWVRVEHPFLLSKTEVTNAQFRRFADLRLYSPGHDSGTLIHPEKVARPAGRAAFPG